MELLTEKDMDKIEEVVKKRYGKVPYIIERMAENPKLLVSKVNYDEAVVDDYKHLDAKTVELISIAVVAALGCEHCIDFHIDAGKKMGITDEQIMTAVMVAGSLANSAVLSKATRSMQKINQFYGEE
ncbi:AhpD family alkylhydroperoxidase [Methanococcus voltae]|uniref:carboxymuconolactone decarboxylase family protein n=1 Tax=Methanococcus voltae TaxID=2188 RepID=UPI001AE6C957|nr:carboxymuconolactone decarboxylase family protein [Methanococcus voltae]MBP2143963.1 AhpD family alkylhydroperoxidase [Methanococcus voltae]